MQDANEGQERESASSVRKVPSASARATNDPSRNYGDGETQALVAAAVEVLERVIVLLDPIAQRAEAGESAVAVGMDDGLLSVFEDAVTVHTKWASWESHRQADSRSVGGGR